MGVGQCTSLWLITLAKVWDSLLLGLIALVWQVECVFHHSYWVYSVALSDDGILSDDGTKALTGSFDGTAKVWNTTSCQELYSFTGHKGRGFPTGIRVDEDMF